MWISSVREVDYEAGIGSRHVVVRHKRRDIYTYTYAQLGQVLENFMATDAA